jgi:hypothetical protein
VKARLISLSVLAALVVPVLMGLGGFVDGHA